MLWKTSWLLIKDIGLTGTGVFLIIRQAFATVPNGYLIGAGLALTVPSVYEHIKALLPGGTSGEGPSSSSSSPPRGSSPSPPSHEAANGPR